MSERFKEKRCPCGAERMGSAEKSLLFSVGKPQRKPPGLGWGRANRGRLLASLRAGGM